MSYRKSPFNYVGDIDEEPEPLYCPYCSKVHITVVLQPRVFENGELPHDADDWLQCYRCGKTVHINQGKEEGEFAPIVDLYETPYDTSANIEIVGKRKHVDRLKKRYKRSKLLEKETAGEHGEIKVILDTSE